MGTTQRTDEDVVVALPTEAEYELADHELSRALGRLELLEIRLRPLADSASDSLAERATAADVGHLWSFIDGIDIQLSAAARDLAGLRQALLQLDHIRRNQPAEAVR